MNKYFWPVCSVVFAVLSVVMLALNQLEASLFAAFIFGVVGGHVFCRRED